MEPNLEKIEKIATQKIPANGRGAETNLKFDAAKIRMGKSYLMKPCCQAGAGNRNITDFGAA